MDKSKFNATLRPTTTLTPLSDHVTLNFFAYFLHDCRAFQQDTFMAKLNYVACITADWAICRFRYFVQETNQIQSRVFCLIMLKGERIKYPKP